jgi:DNA polymerase/3'-5' exonuclease PolX
MMPEQRLPLREAFGFAEAIREAMLPFCERVEVAGSIRRQRPNVKDIEIVAIPKWEEKETEGGLFSELMPVNLLHEWACSPGLSIPVLNREPLSVRWIKPGGEHPVPWKVEAKGKYWRASLNNDYVRLDVFLCSKENWGLIHFIRTGPREFVAEAMVQAIKRKTPVKDGFVHNFGKPVNTPEESDVFKFLGLGWVEPAERRTKEDLRRAVKRRSYN